MDDIEVLLKSKFLAFALKAFATLNRGKKIIVHPFVKLLAEELELVADGTTKRLVITVPPRHLKTFLASICLAAWILAHQPSAKILLLSYGQELADKIAFGIRSILLSGWFLKIFKTRIAKDRHRLMDFVTTAGGGVRSVSIEGGVTGLGADFILVDDPLQIKDCDNIKQLERIQQLFESEIRSRLDNPKKGAIVITAHRLSEVDLPGYVLRQGGWKHLTLPMIAPRSRTYRFGDGEVWRRIRGSLLRPDAFTTRHIRELRASKRPGFETLFQQNPGGDDHLRIKAEHFSTFSPAARRI